MKRIEKYLFGCALLIIASVLMGAEVRHITQIADTKANLILYLDKQQIGMTTDTVTGTGSDLLTYRDADSVFRMLPILGRNAYFNILTCTTLNAVGSQSFTDNVFYIVDNADNTKKIQFQATGITAGQTRTMTVPNVSGTIALLNVNNRFTGIDTFVYIVGTDIRVDNIHVDTMSALDNGFKIVDQADTTKAIKFQASGITAGQTRTLVVPDLSSTIALLGANNKFTGTDTSTNKARFTGGIRSSGTKDSLTFIQADTVNSGLYTTQGIGGMTFNLLNGSGYTDFSVNSAADIKFVAKNGFGTSSIACSSKSSASTDEIIWYSENNITLHAGDTVKIKNGLLYSVKAKIDSLKRSTVAETLKVDYLNWNRPHLAVSFNDSAASCGTTGPTDTHHVSVAGLKLWGIDDTASTITLRNDTVIFKTGAPLGHYDFLGSLGVELANLDSVRIGFRKVGSSLLKGYQTAEGMSAATDINIPFSGFDAAGVAGNKYVVFMINRRNAAVKMHSGYLRISFIHP